MRAVKRGTDPAPACLSAKDRKGRTELDRVRAHQKRGGSKKDSFTFSAYKADEVKRRLEQLFHGKCAYCETYYASSAPVDVEHFRPKAAVLDAPEHPGYWWLAMRWENLLPSCIDCNRKRKQVIHRPSDSLLELHETAVLSGKKDSFPIQGVRAMPEMADFAAEQAMLLDPCVDDPAEHLEFVFEGTPPIALVVPKAELAPLPQRSIRGATSIQVYGLNRVGLVQERTRVLRRLEFLGSVVAEVGGLADELEAVPPGAIAPDRASAIVRRLRLLMDRALAEMREMAAPDASYSTMAAAWIQRYLATL